MNRAITAISYMFFGASILIFISALLIPVLKDSPSTDEKSNTVLDSSKTDRPSPTPLNVIDRTPAEPPEQNPAYDRNEPASPAPVQPESNAEPAPSTASAESLTAQSQAGGSAESRPAQPVEAAAVPPAPKAETSPATQSQAEPALTRPQEAAPAETATAPQSVPEEPQDTAMPLADAVKSLPKAEASNLLVLGEGYFSSGSVAPQKNAEEAIDKIVPIILSRPQDNVLVEGHADKIMSNRISALEASKLNKTVSLRRAIAVAMVLEQKGVASDRIIVSGRGDSVPIASNDTEEGRAKNRRVEIKLAPAR